MYFFDTPPDFNTLAFQCPTVSPGDADNWDTGFPPESTSLVALTVRTGALNDVVRLPGKNPQGNQFGEILIILDTPAETPQGKDIFVNIACQLDSIVEKIEHTTIAASFCAVTPPTHALHTVKHIRIHTLKTYFGEYCGAD